MSKARDFEARKQSAVAYISALAEIAPYKQVLDSYGQDVIDDLLSNGYRVVDTFKKYITNSKTFGVSKNAS